MDHSNADQMLNEVELDTVSGSNGIDASLERFAAANAGSDSTSSVLASLAASLRRNPTGRK